MGAADNLLIRIEERLNLVGLNLDTLFYRELLKDEFTLLHASRIRTQFFVIFFMGFLGHAEVLIHAEMLLLKHMTKLMLDVMNLFVNQ